jgi:glycosyltransferase involved in cell wall biosynthesis
MKLIIQIPCFNEEKTLPLVVESIPKEIPGIDTIEVLIIDDGSSDKTSEVAKELGVDHIIKHTQNKGLATSFADGIHHSLQLGADIIVNTDADNQYPQKDIPRLIDPILKKEAEIVIADRQTDKIKHFSLVKKLLQKLGSTVVKKLSRAPVPDAVSGFRAYSRSAALQLNIVTDFSYVIETIIQAQYKRIALATVKVTTNPPTRKSRLFRNMFEHIRHSTATIIRVYTMYRPFTVFIIIGSSISVIGIVGAIRFIYYLLLNQGNGHIQSLIFAAVFIMVGFQIFMTGLVADLEGINRKLIENTLGKMKDMELKQLKGEKLNNRTLEYVKRITNGYFKEQTIN